MATQITLNKHHAGYVTLQAVYPETKNLSPFVCRKNKKFTFISQEQKVYLYLEKQQITAACLVEIIKDFINQNEYDATIDLCSFVCKTKNKLKIATEAVIYAAHRKFSLKTRKEQPLTIPKYNISTLVCEQNCSTADRRRQFAASMEEQFKTAMITGYFTNFARDLQDTPPNIANAQYLANVILAEAQKTPQVKVTILDQSQIKALKMNLVLAVNAGSKHEPRVVVLEYHNDQTTKTTYGFAGKGVTFDTGGYNIKPTPHMRGMKFDMSGAAIAAAATLAVAKANLKVNLVTVMPFVENGIGTVPESVITSMSGKTVQINNTDAEGRLILADGVTLAVKKGATKLIEISTLTGAALVALGKNRTGVFTPSDEFYLKFANAATESGEQIWRMPLDDEHTKMLTNTEVADISNIGEQSFPYAGASQGGAFIHFFAQGKPFLHLDIAGTATKKDRGTGVMVKTMFSFFQNLYD